MVIRSGQCSEMCWFDCGFGMNDWRINWEKYTVKWDQFVLFMIVNISLH